MDKQIRRDRRLTPEEAARLREARAEFANRPTQSELLSSGDYTGPMSVDEYVSWRKGIGSAPLTTQLQTAIAASGEPLPEIAAASGVSASVLQRFVSGQRGITLDAAGRIASHLGLALVPARGG
jgi:hypothetical protein